jgi:hypothetical protein
LTNPETSMSSRALTSLLIAASLFAPLAAEACCNIVANPAMRGRLGRVVVAYPIEVADARMDVFRAGDTKSIASGYGNLAFDLLPGTYDVEISGKRVAGVTVQSGHDTQIKVGVLRVSAAPDTRIDLVDPAQPADAPKYTGAYGDKLFGLPIGEVGVLIDRQTVSVTITEGQVVDF